MAQTENTNDLAGDARTQQSFHQWQAAARHAGDEPFFALRALLHPDLRPFLLDPTLVLDGQFPSLDAHAAALLETQAGQNAARFLSRDDRALLEQIGLRELIPLSGPQISPNDVPRVGTIWGSLYLPGEQKAAPCRLTAAWASPAYAAAPFYGWPDPQTLRPTSDMMQHTGRVALAAALAFLQNRPGGLPPNLTPRALVWDTCLLNLPDALLEGTHGDSLQLPLALVFLSLLLKVPLSPHLAATGKLGASETPQKVAALPVGFTAEKAESLAFLQSGLFLAPPQSDFADAAEKAGLIANAAPSAFTVPSAPDADEPLAATLCVVFDAAGGGETPEAAAQILARFIQPGSISQTADTIRALFHSPQAAFSAALCLRHALRCRIPWPLPPLAPAQTLLRAPLPRMGVFIGEAGKHKDESANFVQAETVARAAHEAQILINANGHGEKWPDKLVPLGRFRFWDLAPPVLLHALHDNPPDKNEPDAPENTLDSRRHNLPVEAVPLAARTEEIAQITRLLIGPSPVSLLTVSGGAGVGKTRLLQEAAAKTGAFWTGGIWLVPANQISSEDDLAARIAEIGDLRLSDTDDDEPAPLALRLLRGLQSINAPVLLIIDTGEAAPDAVIAFAARFAGNSGHLVTCAVASRRPLGVAGETLFTIEPLPLPKTEADVAASPAGAFFLSHSSRPLTTNNEAAFVGAICRAVCGVPLALLLLAAQTPFVSCEMMARRLSELLPEPAGGNLAQTPPFPRIIRQTLRFIYETLTSDAQIVLRRASVLGHGDGTTGGWETDAAIAVSGLFDDDARDAIENLLARQIWRRHGASQTRMTVSPVIHAWAETLLQNANETEIARRAHADYFYQKAETLGRLWDTPDETTAFDILWADRTQLFACADFLKSHDAPRFIAFVAHTGNFLRYRGLTKEWQEWPRRAVRLIELQTRPDDFDRLSPETASLYARLYRFCAVGGVDSGDISGAAVYIGTGLRLARAAENARDTADLLNVRASVRVRTGENDAALADWSEARTCYETINNKRGIVTTLANIGLFWDKQKNYDAARACHEEAAQICRRTRDLRGLCYALANQGCNAFYRADAQAAQAFFAEQFRIARTLKDAQNIAGAALNLGDVFHTLQNDTKTALPYLVLGEQLFEKLRHPFAQEAARILQTVSPAYFADLDFLRRDLARRTLADLMAYPLTPPRVLVLPG